MYGNQQKLNQEEVNRATQTQKLREANERQISMR